MHSLNIHDVKQISAEAHMGRYCAVIRVELGDFDVTVFGDAKEFPRFERIAAAITAINAEFDALGEPVAQAAAE